MTDRLFLSVEGVTPTREVTVDFDDGALVEDLARALTGSDESSHSIVVARTRTPLLPRVRLAEADVRSGDAVEVRQLTRSVRSDSTDQAPAHLRFTSGGRSGQVIPLRRGVNTIGRDPANGLTIDDGLASRFHAAVNVTDIVAVSDLGSTNGTRVSGAPIVEETPVGPADEIEVGDTRFTVVLTSGGASGSGPGGRVRFNRPPRVVPPYEGIEVEIPAPPGDAPRQRLPLIAAITPVLLAIFMYLITKNVASILFMAMSPIMMVGTWWENRRGARADHAAAVADWKERVAEIIELLAAEREREITRRREESPPFRVVESFVDGPGSRLWERGVEDPDFLDLRVGITDLPSRTSVKTASGGSRPLRMEIDDVPHQFAVVPQVPLTVGLVDGFGLGVAGERAAATGVSRLIVAEAAVLHSPAELVICAAIGEESVADWRWLRWLPHVHAAPLQPYPLATEQHHVVELLDAIEKYVSDVEDEGEGVLPRLLLVLDDDVPVERSRIVPLLKKLRGKGVSFVWTAGGIESLPRPCGAVVAVDPGGHTATVSVVAEGAVHESVMVESLSAVDAESVARSLAPIVDVSHAGSAGSLPRSVTLVDLFGSHDVLVEPDSIIERWNESELSIARQKDQSGGLRATVGVAGTPLTIDIRRDGPHALVAGTTGAGKSEFLQTWVATLAASHPPERVTFLFVDYKGGSAFKDCIDLPHTVGLVTDLDAHQVERALTSLNAELHRRERILNQAGVKDLIAMEEAGVPDTPPNLLIVVDEFAALAKEVPEFVDGVVNVAQRGRSLGLHLVLATQRPAGVVTDNIRANTNLRVALRMADEEESRDVVGSSIAAHFSRDIPGRGVIRVGPSELLTFQSGYTGARTDSRETAPPVVVSELHFDRITPVESRDGNGSPPADGPTDLERLVRAVSEAHRKLGGAPPRRPWQEPLPVTIDLLDRVFPRTGTPERIYLGVRDEPERQARSWLTLEPEKEGSWLVVGTSGAGKTVFLRSLAASLGIGERTEDAEVYALDFGGRGLQMLDDLPHVGSVIAGADIERVTRLLRYVEGLVETRADAFAGVRAGSLEEYRGLVPESVERRVFVLLDGVPAYLQALERLDRGRWIEALPRLVAAGRQVGVHFALTTDRRTGLPIALTSNIQRVFTLRLAGEDDYRAAGVPHDILGPKSPPGRVIDGDIEGQIAITGGSPDGAAQGMAISGLGREIRSRDIVDIPQIGVLPVEVYASSLSHTPGRIAVGLADSDLSTVSLDPAIGLFAVVGPSGSGRTSALRRIAGGARSGGVEGEICYATVRRRADIAGPWDRVASGSADAVELVEEATRAIVGGRFRIVLIDDVVDLLESEAEPVFTDLVKALREHPGLLVVAGDASRVRRAYSDGLNEIRSAKSGLLLQPDFDYDPDLLGATIVRPGGRAFPPGRGYFVLRGSAALMQLAIDLPGAP